MKSGPCSPQLEKAHTQQQRPNAAKKKKKRKKQKPQNKGPQGGCNEGGTEGAEREEEGEGFATLEDEEVAGHGKLEREYVWLRVHVISQLTPMFLRSSPPIEFPLA